MSRLNNKLYAIAFPLAKKDTYGANENVDFILSFENKDMVPGSLVISGECAVYINKATTTAPAVNQNVMIDPDAGYHAVFRDFNTNLKNTGIVENFSYYPRYVKMKTQCNKLRESLGVETSNAVEGKCWNEIVRRGYNLGLEAAEPFVPFVIKPDICVNKSNVPIPGNQVGTVRIRVRLAPDDEVLYGTDVTSASGYVLRNLECRYEVMPDDGSRPPLQMEFFNVDRQVIESNNANLATFVAKPCDSVSVSFNRVADEADVTKNYLRCQPLPGKPLGSDTTIPNYGAERVYYSINDTQTALVGFTMESREEIIWNYLRSFNNEPAAYSNIMQRLQAPIPDGYGLGINYGTLLDFTQQKFEMEVNSQCSEPYSAYLYFRSLLELQA